MLAVSSRPTFNRIPLHRVAARVRHALRRVLLASVTAGLAWWIASLLLSPPAPIFAPIASMVSLVDEPGARGRRAFRVIGGVLTGVAVGEVLVRYLGVGPWQPALAVLVATLLVTTASTNPLPIIQAGVAALLVIALHAPQTGFSRLFSALIGGALALLVSQVLVTPSPLTILSNSVCAALSPAAEGLRGAADALRRADPEAAWQNLERVRRGHHELAAFETARQSARALARQSVRGRRQRAAVLTLDEHLAGVDPVHTDSVLVARATHKLLARQDGAPDWLVQVVDDLAEAVRTFCAAPLADRNRESARELAAPATRIDPTGLPPGSSELASEIRLVARDLHELARGPEGG